MMSDLLERKAIALATSNAANQAVALISKYEGCIADSSLLCLCNSLNMKESANTLHWNTLGTWTSKDCGQRSRAEYGV